MCLINAKPLFICFSSISELHVHPSLKPTSHNLIIYLTLIKGFVSWIRAHWQYQTSSLLRHELLSVKEFNSNSNDPPFLNSWTLKFYENQIRTMGWTVSLLTVAPSYSWITKLPNAEESTFCCLHHGYKFGNGTLCQEYNLFLWTLAHGKTTVQVQ